MANPIITRVQIEGNDVVSFLSGTTAPYTYVRSMSQILPQNPTYISYRYDSITISQVGGEAFTFTVYTVTDIGGNTFPILNFQDPSDVVQAKTIEIYRLLVTSVFKGCCACGDEVPQCAIQYVVGDPEGDAPLEGEFNYTSGTPGTISFNYITGNNQDFTNFFPTVQDGSWIFLFSKTDPTVYAIIQVSDFTDQVTYAKFTAIELNAAGLPFPVGTIFCVDFTSVGGSLVQGWQDTLDISSVLDKDNTIDGSGFNFVFDNNNSFAINSPGGVIQADSTGASLNSGSQQVLVTTGYIDIITPLHSAAGTGWVLAKTAAGHVEYVEAGTGTISSIELLMPPAFTVSDPNPLTTDGTFTVTVDGTEDQYINGLGELAEFPVYTVENGLHAFGGVPGEAPPDPFLFHLGGPLIEDTTITATNGTSQYVLGVLGTANQNTRRPFSVANLGDGGAAVFSDFGTGTRPNPSVEMITDNDLSQPILNLHMQGNLPDANNTMLRLRYSGRPDLATTTIDYQFRNNNAVAANSNFIGSRLSTEVVNFVDNNEQTRFNLQLMEGGDLANKLQIQGYGQLVLNEYGLNVFSNGATNINNSLSYVLGVDGTGNVWKTSAGTGTVTSINGAGLITTSPNPITTIGTVTTNMATNRLVGRYSPGSGIMQEITIGDGLALSAGGELTADGSVPVYTVNNGLSPDPLDPNNFQLGGPLVKDTTITGASEVYGIYFNQLSYAYTNASEVDITTTNASGTANIYMFGGSGQFTYINSNGSQSALLVYPALSSLSYVNNLGIGGKIEIDDSGMHVVTPGVQNSTATVGQVLTLQNATTGQAEWQDGGGGTYTVNNGLEPQVLPTPDPNNFQLGGPLVRNTTITGGTTPFSHILTLENLAAFFVDTRGKLNLATEIGNDKTEYFQESYQGGISYSDSLSGQSATIALQGYSDDFTLSVTMGINNAFGGAGFYAGVDSTSFPYTENALVIQTPNVSNGTAVVGQVLTLVSMAGGNAGKAEWQDAGGSGTTYDSNQGVYKDTSLTPETFMLGAPLGSEGGIAFQQDRYIYTDDFKLSLRGNPTGDWQTTDGSILDIIFDASTSGVTAAGIKVDASAGPGKTAGIAINQGGGIAVLIDGEGDGINLTSDGAPIATYLETTTGLNAFQESYRMVRRTELLDPAISNGFGTGITFVLSDGNFVVPQAQGIINFYYSDITPGTQAADMQFSVNFPGLGTDTPSLTLKGTNEPGQIQFNQYGQTPANFPDASPVWALGVDASGNVVEFEPGGGGGGGAGGRVYYLNGSVNQGTFGGVTNMRQMSPVPIAGLGTDFTISTNGYIQSFITNAGDPNKSVIPAGNWTFQFWLSANSSGGSPSFYVDLFKYDTVALTLTLISTGVGAPESISNGTAIDLYTTALTVPQTPLAPTDRLAIRVWINNSGRTITLHTEGVHFSQVITTFPSGIVSLNGLTATDQTFATPGTSGTAPSWSSVSTAHTLNIPLASAAGVTAGLISKTDYDTFNGKVGPTRTISTTAPLAGGGDLSADRTLSIADAAADGTTKGAAAFTASDFNSAAGVISIDYANGQSASSSTKGFLTSADWTRFDSFKTQTISVSVDGSGGVITAGNKGYVRVPYACTISFWSIITTGGGTGAVLSFDILRANNTIPSLSIVGAGTKPNVSGATQLSANTAPSGWTSTTLNANDILAFNVDSGAAVYTWAILQLTVTRT